MQKRQVALNEKIGRRLNDLWASEHSKFLHNVFVFCVYNVCCCMSEDNAFEKLQRIVKEKKCKKLQKWENAKTWKKEYVAKVSIRQQKV